MLTTAVKIYKLQVSGTKEKSSELCRRMKN